MTMGLQETEELDLDLILFGDPGDDSTDPDEIICGCGHGRGRVETRTVPRLPQAAILHRISLMEQRNSNSSTSATGVRRGRGRARILRDNATSNLPTVGKSKRIEEEIPEMPQSTKQTSTEPISKQTEDMPVKMSSNWLHDGFPTLSAAHQDTDSDSSSKANRQRKRKPNFQEIRAKVEKLKPGLKNDIPEVENYPKHSGLEHTHGSTENIDEILTPTNKPSHEVVDTYNITKEEEENNGLKVFNGSNDIPEPKINQKNFMKQSKIEFFKMLPEGYNKYYSYSKRNHQERKRDMDRFVLNDDLPEYCKYEVTHDDIRKHNKKAAKVPDTVKGKVNEWLNKVHVDHIEDTKKIEDLRDNGLRKALAHADTVINEDCHKLFQNSTEVDTANSLGLENGYPVGVQTKFDRGISNSSNENSESFSENVMPDHESSIMKLSNIEAGTVTADIEDLSVTNKESYLCQNSSFEGKVGVSVTEKIDESNKTNNAMADLYIDNENLCDKLIEEIDAMELSEVEISESNNLDIDTDNEYICQDVSQVNTSNIYVSDEESNMLLESIRAVEDNHTNFEQNSVISMDSNKACISESDFVVKYKNKNEKKIGKEKSNLGRIEPSSEIPSNTWRLNGERVIQFDGLSANCVTSHLEEVISNFGTVSDSERKVFGDRLSIRFKLHDEDACDFAVQCLHDTDCLFPDSNSVLECFKVG